MSSNGSAGNRCLKIFLPFTFLFIRDSLFRFWGGVTADDRAQINTIWPREIRQSDSELEMMRTAWRVNGFKILNAKNFLRSAKAFDACMFFQPIKRKNKNNVTYMNDNLAYVKNDMKYTNLNHSRKHVSMFCVFPVVLHILQIFSDISWYHQVCSCWINPTCSVWQVPTEGVDTVIQKSARSSGHQSSRHRSRDKSRDRDQERDRDRDKDWPPEKLSDSHSPVSLREEKEVFSVQYVCICVYP